jgi:hypothetical protein
MAGDAAAGDGADTVTDAAGTATVAVDMHAVVMLAEHVVELQPAEAQRR